MFVGSASCMVRRWVSRGGMPGGAAFRSHPIGRFRHGSSYWALKVNNKRLPIIRGCVTTANGRVNLLLLLGVSRRGTEGPVSTTTARDHIADQPSINTRRRSAWRAGLLRRRSCVDGRDGKVRSWEREAYGSQNGWSWKSCCSA